MNVGLIADDAKKKLMQNCCIAYRGILSRHQLYATGTTGRLIQEAAGLNVHKLLEGHVGGEQQMSAMIEQNQMDLVLYFRDPDRETSIRNGNSDLTKAIRSFLLRLASTRRPTLAHCYSPLRPRKCFQATSNPF